MTGEAATEAAVTIVPGFGDRLADAFAAYGQLCVGIDPHPYLLREWELAETAAGARDLGLRIVDAAHGQVGILKPQVAFFERYGSAGFRALEEVLAAARSAGLLIIADAKRGDIGTTAEAYGQAWLSPGSPLEADAMTIAAFQGVGSIAPVMRLAQAQGKGLFVLAATSNSEAARIQTALVQTAPIGSAPIQTAPIQTGSIRTVSRAIIDDVTAFNAAQPTRPIASIGVVLGATLDLAGYGIDNRAPAERNRLPVLAPGFGHQGARLRDARSIFGTLAGTTIVSESRGILSAGASGVAAAIARRSADVREHLG